MEEQRTHKKTLYSERSSKRKLIEKDEIRSKWKQNKTNSRGKKREENENAYKIASAQAKACQRQKAKENDNTATKNLCLGEKNPETKGKRGRCSII